MPGRTAWVRCAKLPGTPFDQPGRYQSPAAPLLQAPPAACPKSRPQPAATGGQAGERGLTPSEQQPQHCSMNTLLLSQSCGASCSATSAVQGSCFDPFASRTCQGLPPTSDHGGRHVSSSHLQIADRASRQQGSSAGESIEALAVGSAQTTLEQGLANYHGIWSRLTTLLRKKRRLTRGSQRRRPAPREPAVAGKGLVCLLSTHKHTCPEGANSNRQLNTSSEPLQGACHRPHSLRLTPTAHQPARVEGSSRAQLAAQPGGCFGKVQVAHLSQGTGSVSICMHDCDLLRFRLHTCCQGLAAFRFARDSALRLRWAARQGGRTAHRSSAAAGRPSQRRSSRPLIAAKQAELLAVLPVLQHAVSSSGPAYAHLGSPSRIHQDVGRLDVPAGSGRMKQWGALQK